MVTKLRPTVYMTQEGHFDYSGADDYGELKFITAEDFNSAPNSIINTQVINDIVGALRDFNKESDWVIASGSPYITAIVFLVLGLMGIESVNILRWDNRSRKYNELTINLIEWGVG